MTDQNSKRIPASNAGKIAIVGSSVRLPKGCDTPSRFWEVLINGDDLISEISPDRWNPETFYYPARDIQGKAYTKAAGQLENIWDFDADFFNISPREAAQMDPQQRLLLEMSWEAFEDAGIKPSSIRGSNASVCVGISSNDFGTSQFGDSATGNSFFMLGSTMSIASNRLSYFYDLHGSSFSVDTACSSSLYALEQACNRIASGQSDIAICGGVSVLLTPFPFIGFSQANMLSPDGRCKAFDSQGNGYVRSEGGGVLILKDLDQALADGNPIIATIEGIGTNADGRTNGMSLPSSDHQEALLRRVYKSANIAPDEVQYIEAHGTGTIVGDAAEVGAIGRFFGEERKTDQPLLIGSAKSNAGHLEAGSGMIGLIKAALVVKNAEVPPSIHVKELRQDIPFEDYKIKVATEHHTFDKSTKMTVGVNSFGFGGANGHAILSSYSQQAEDQKTVSTADDTQLPPLLLSARSEFSLKALCLDYVEILSQPEFSLNDFSTLAASTVFHREDFEYRLGLSANTLDEIRHALLKYAKEDTADFPCQTGHTHGADKPIAFIFNGNGSQYVGMAADLLKENETFAKKIRQIDAIVQSKAGWSIVETLKNSTEEHIADTTVAQPLIMSIQIGLIEVLKSQGIEPEASIGHSVGEIAAAYSAGHLSLEQAVTVILTRSNAQGNTRGHGGMAAIEIAPEKLDEIIAELALDVEIAGYNGPTSLTLSGHDDQLDILKPYCKKNRILFKKLDLEYPFHSSLMDPVEDEILTNLAKLSPENGSGTLISTVTGQEISGEELTANYWWRNIRKPVLFDQAINSAWDQGCRMFLEIGPKAILGGYLKNSFKQKSEGFSVLPAITGKADADRIAHILEAVYVEGGRIDYASQFSKPVKSELLPTYPWDRQTYHLETTSEARFSLTADWGGPLLGEALNPEQTEWMVHLGALKPNFLKDHLVNDTVIFPAAGFLEIVLAAGRKAYGEGNLVVENLEIHAPLALEEKALRTLIVDLDPVDGKVQIQSRPYLSDSAGLTNVTANVVKDTSSEIPNWTWADHNDALAEAPFDKSGFYELTQSLGLTYGPNFQTVQQIQLAENLVSAKIQLATDCLETADLYNLHPAIGDGCLQSLFTLLTDPTNSVKAATYLPSVFGKVRLYQPGAKAVRSIARINRISSRSIIADFRLVAEDGSPVADLQDCRFRLFESQGQSKTPTLYQQNYVPTPLLEGHPLPSGIEEANLPFEATSDASSYGEEVAPLTDALISAFVLETLETLGANLKSGFRVLDLIATEQIDPAQSRFVNFLLNLLKEDGLLEREDDTWKLDEEAELFAASDIWRLLIADHPELLPELTMIGRTGQNLPEILSGAVLPEDLPIHSETSLAKQLVEGSAYSATSDTALNSALAEFLSSLPESISVRILEFGGQNILSTKSFLNQAPKDRLIYDFVATDSNAHHRARLEFSAMNGVSCQYLEDTSGEALQSYMENAPQYDVIIFRGTPVTPPRYEVIAPMIRSLLKLNGRFFLGQNSGGRISSFLAGGAPNWWDRSTSTNQLRPLTLNEATWMQQLAGNEEFETELLLSTDNTPFHNSMLLTGSHVKNAALPKAQPDVEASGLKLIIVSNSEDELKLAKRIAALEGPKEHHILKLGTEFTPDLQEEMGLGAATTEEISSLSKLIVDSGKTVESCLYLAGLSLHNEAEALAAQDVRCLPLVNLLQGLSPSLLSKTRLLLVTQGSQKINETDQTQPLHAPLWGLGRVITNEFPDLQCKLIDLPAGTKALFGTATAEILSRELETFDWDREIVIREGGRFASRIRQADLTTQSATSDSHFRLDFAKPGALENLTWFEMDHQEELGADEIEVDMKSTGLNFRDVMLAMGILKDEAVENGYAGPTLGMEGAGIVKSVGSGITDFAPGDRVMCFAPNCFADIIRTRTTAVAKIPDEMSYDEAATIPSVFFTIYYALHYLARVEPGEKVLIHGAAGGVGLAAIQYCQHIGAEIYVTAGSAEKRDFLKLLGCENVLNSRTLEFADQIMELTNGEGVDVILNSLSGQAIPKNLSILKPFGRFLELGKRDFYADSKIGLRPFRNNITYYGIDADQLLAEKPALSSRLFKEMMELFETEAFRPLVHLKFKPSQIEEAFRTLQQSRHIGKIVVSMDDTADRKTVAAQKQATTPQSHYDGACLITGGQGGFGLATAKNFASKHFDHLVLIGRSGVKTPEDQAIIDQLRADGIQIDLYNADVTKRQELETLLADLRSKKVSISGIIHCAMVLEDGLIANMAPEGLQKVAAPKIAGAWNLHELTLSDPIELFLMYSSATTYIGNPGQASYVAANSYLEALTDYRRRQGLPATTVAWGAIDDVGVLAANEDVKDILVKRTGLKAMSSAAALSGLEDVVLANKDNVAMLQLDWGNVTRNFAVGSTSRYLDIQHLVGEAGSVEDADDFIASLEGKSHDEIVELVQALVISQISAITGSPTDKISAEKSLFDLGIDSLMALELTMELERKTGIELSSMSIIGGGNISDLADKVASLLTGEGEATEQAGSEMDVLMAQHGITEDLDDSPAKNN
ncbi:type I polyketide synthase [Sneathiella limimaris]|uniref:type I polyketide synthase n=1 Tax=Sneathiella limimaris TaxID=1964213 RepID=UPI00146A1187|nr:type I polyketide synthase [Sneathiella limimaris]